MLFSSDLARAIDPVPDDTELAFIRATSYGAGTSSTGSVRFLYDDANVEGRHVLLVRGKWFAF
jgi:hypoxanthine phosphoribosyltransferase